MGGLPLPFSEEVSLRRIKLKFFIQSLMGALGFMFLGVSGSYGQTESALHYVGQVFDLQTNRLLHTETYREFFDEKNQRFAQTLYRNLDGEVFAQKEISFEKSLLIPDFTTEDSRTGYLEGVGLTQDALEVLWRKDGQALLEKKSLPIPNPGAVDAGIHYYIKKNWQALWEGQTLGFNLIVPAELDYFPFEIKKIRQYRRDNEEVVVYELKVENFLLSLFIDPILLTYEVPTQRLLVYEGIYNIRDGQGDNLSVRIVIDYL